MKNAMFVAAVATLTATVALAADPMKNRATAMDQVRVKAAPQVLVPKGQSRSAATEIEQSLTGNLPQRTGH